jgi:hypothetical protein
MIFARKSDDGLASLVKKIDALVAENTDKDLRAFVNLIGEDREALEEQAKAFAEENEIANTPIVVPVEFENGPANFGIHPDAEVTVMLYLQTSVKANHALAAGEIDEEESVEAIVADVDKILE